MKKYILNILFFSFVFIASGQINNNLKVQKIVLDNGLTVLLNEDHTEPIVYGAVVVKVGSKNDPENATGMAHYFEHIMFKGTDSIGTLNYEAEKVYLDSISLLYDILNITTDEKARHELEIKINNLSILAAEYAIPNEVDKLLKKYGGTQVNAFTSHDATFYLNTFPSSQIEQWLDIYAERFRNPVFRLFQSELETVFEERNMYADNRSYELNKNLLKMMFKKHPYRNPLIGTVEDLKNPSISKMEKFYHDYYVANNMALIITGDFNTEEIIPLIKAKFSIWKSGNIPAFDTVKYKEDPYQNREFLTGRYVLPKIGIILYRGVPASHPDEVALNFCCNILSHNGTGLLDTLRYGKKVMDVIVNYLALNDEGIIYIPFSSHSLPKTENAIMQYIDSLKTGNFSDELLNSIKIEYKKKFDQALENPMNRASQILKSFSTGVSWENYLIQMEHYSNINKDEIVAAANKYFGENRLVFYNKRKLFPNTEKIKKPPFSPITPQNTEKESAFAIRLENIIKNQTNPIFVDFNTDFKFENIKEKVHLITSNNPINNIFSLNISFGTGRQNDSLLQLVDHIAELGTETKNLKELKQAFQKLGSSFWMSYNSNQTNISITGFDENLNETLVLINELLTCVKPDDKQMKKLINDAKVFKYLDKKNQSTLNNALLEYALLGNSSSYNKRFTVSDLKKTNSSNIVNAFKNIINYETTITYVGKLTFDEVKKSLLNNINFPDNLIEKDIYIKPYLEYSKNTIFIYHNSKAKQTAINVYVPGKYVDDEQRLQVNLFNLYFSVGMSSIFFQEIREFRSLSYYPYGSFKTFSRQYPDLKGYFTGSLSTQADKTNEAIEIVDKLITSMPEKPERLNIIKSSAAESINSSMPNFRSIPNYAYSLIEQGYTEDTRKISLEYIQNAKFEDITTFYNYFFKNQPIIYTITGNIDKINLKELERYGTIIELNSDKFIRD